MQPVSALRRLSAATLVAVGVALLWGPPFGLIVAGIGVYWSGVDIIGLVAGVNRFRHAARVRGDPPQRSLPDDGPAPAAGHYGEAA